MHRSRRCNQGATYSEPWTHSMQYSILSIIPRPCLSQCKSNEPLVINPFQTNVPVMEKSGGRFLLTKCVKNTCEKVAF